MIDLFTMFSGGGNGETALIQAAAKYRGNDRDGRKDVRVSGRRKKVNGPGKRGPQTKRKDGRALDGTRAEISGVRFAGYSEFDPVCGRRSESVLGEDGKPARCGGRLVLDGFTSSICDTCKKTKRQSTIAVYRYHFPEHRNFGDATTIVPADLPDFNFLIAGFPCQAFSVAGKQKGFADTRGTLFFEIARILDHKRPAHFLLENVKNLVGHDTGKTFHRILGVLADLGYFVEWTVLNSKDYGVPQNRERVFIIGHLADRCSRQILSIGHGGSEIVPEAIVGSDLAGTITTRNNGPECQFDRSSTLVGQDISFAVDSNYPKGSSPSDMESGMKRQMIDADKREGIRELRQVAGDENNAEANRVYDASAGLARTIKGGGGRGAKTGLYQIAESDESQGRQPFQQNRVYDSDGIALALQADLPSGSYAITDAGKGRKKQVRTKTLPPVRPASGGGKTPMVNHQDIEVRAVQTPGVHKKGQNGKLIKDAGEDAFSLTSRDPHGVIISGETALPRIRRLTPIECERLQGMADDHTRYGLFDDDKIIEISDSHRYHICGNAFTVNTLEAILLRMLSDGCLSLETD